MLPFMTTMSLFILGLLFFMEGLNVGLMPFAETLGRKLPARSPLPVVLLIACTLGVGVTFAEPAIGALRATGQIVDVDRSPHLYTMLNDWAGALEAGGFHSWWLDPQNAGDWAIFGPGQVSGLLPTMAQPHGRIHFCGEHTATMNRGMEAAMESAERAVVELIERL